MIDVLTVLLLMVSLLGVPVFFMLRQLSRLESRIRDAELESKRREYRLSRLIDAVRRKTLRTRVELKELDEVVAELLRLAGIEEKGSETARDTIE